MNIIRKLCVGVIQRLMGPTQADGKLPDGLLIGKDCDVMDNVSFGSEPYLVQLGDHARIANGV